LSVGAHHGAIACDRCCSDDQIVSATRGACPACVREQRRVRARHDDVVHLDRDAPEDAFHEREAPLATPLRRERYPDEQLRRGDRRDRDVVVVGNNGVEIAADALAGDEDTRVENQPFQSRSCGVSDSRRARSSDAQAPSAPRSRRIAFTSRPPAPEAGPMHATARPRRTTTNVSPWRSTASRSSENRRAASVALIRRTVNQIIRLPMQRHQPPESMWRRKT